MKGQILEARIAYQSSAFIRVARRVPTELTQSRSTWGVGRSALRDEGVEHEPGFAIPKFDADDVMDQFFLVSTPPVLNLDLEIWRDAVAVVKELYRPLIARCRNCVTPYSEVRLEVSKAAGVLWRDMGWQNKGDVVIKATERLAVEMMSLSTSECPHGVSGKVELLKINKPPRSFEVAPMELVMTGNRWFQKFQEEMKHGAPWSAYGFNMHDGGWMQAFGELETRRYKYASDVKKWDKHLLLFLLEVVLFEVLVDLHDGPDYRSWLINFYRLCVNTVYVLPNGEVFLKIKAYLWNSGTVGTTYFAILMHALIFAYHCIRVGVPMDRIPQEVFSSFADDSKGASDYERVASYKERSTTYGHFGLELKAEDDFFSESTEGMTFLGFKNRKRGSLNTPVFSRDRILSALINSDGQVPRSVWAARAVAMYELSLWDDEPYHLLDGSITPFCDLVYRVVNRILSQLERAEIVEQVGEFYVVLQTPAFRRQAFERRYKEQMMQHSAGDLPPKRWERHL